nr:hypothetical protein [Tanacetum cinerariifolium]
VPPSRNDWDLLFQPMFDELLNPPPSVDPYAPEIIALIADVIPPVQEKSKLDEDKEGKAVDSSHYHGMIGTLLYLIASRPDLQFAICMCSRTMDTTIDQQLAMDEALIPHAKRLRIGRSNFHLLSDISSKESTLQLVYDVLRLTPFFKAFLVTADEDFVYQVEHKDTKKSNEMYYPRFRKVIIHHFMSKDPSIPRRNKVNWHYVRDDHMFTTIKLVTKHQNTQQFGALLPIELTNEDIRNSNAYIEYYAVATRATPPNPKASVRKTRSSSDTTVTPPTPAAGPRTGTRRVPDVPTDESEEEISWNSTDEEGDDDEGNDEDDEEEGSNDEQASDEEEFIHPILSTQAEEETRDEESFDPILKTPEDTNDEGNGKENLGINVGREEGNDEEEEEDELYKDVNINQGRGIQTNQEFEDSHVTLTPVNPDGQQQTSSVSSQFVTSMLNLTPDAGMESIFGTTSQIDVQTLTSVALLPMSAPILLLPPLLL